MRLVVVLSVLAGVGGLTVLAQDAAPLAFEVASIRPSPPPSPNLRRGIQVSPGRFTSTGMSPMALIRRAYGLPFWKIKNAPGWVNSENFDVQATFAPSSTPAQVNVMLRTLLERRFRLSVEWVTQEMDTDILILANRDRSLGAGLHPVDVDCETKQLREGSAPGLFPPETRPACGVVVVSVRFSSGNPASMQRSSVDKYVAFTMTGLADLLSGSRERPILDRTELAGEFDIELDYASQQAPAALVPGAAAPTPGDAPPLPEALEQQLGLRLRRERNLVEVLIVRSVERPRIEEN